MVPDSPVALPRPGSSQQSRPSDETQLVPCSQRGGEHGDPLILFPACLSIPLVIRKGRQGVGKEEKHSPDC